MSHYINARTSALDWEDDGYVDWENDDSGCCDHNRLLNKRGGEGFEGWIIPCCSCGWEGKKHEAHNDYQHSNAAEQWMRHKNDDK